MGFLSSMSFSRKFIEPKEDAYRISSFQLVGSTD